MDNETLQQLAALLAQNNKDMLAEMQQLRTDLGGRIDGVSTDLGKRIDGVSTDLGGRIDSVSTDLGGRIDSVNTDMQQLRTDVQDMLHDQTEGIVQMTQRMIDEAKPEIAAEVMRHMKVLLENDQNKKIQALYEDHEATKARIEKLEKAANE